MKGCSVIIAALLLSGCATEAKYNNKLNTWLGQDELKLIHRWGPPQRTYETGGSKFLTYVDSGNVVMPGTPPSYTTNVYGSTAYTTATPGMPAQNIALDCETTFEIKDAKITDWSWRGNNCVSE